MTQPIILGLCTANRCRSQMFESIMRSLSDKKFTVISAGTKSTFVHPLATKVLSEIGCSTDSQSSKKIIELSTEKDVVSFENNHQEIITVPLSQIKTVITLCGGASESCPNFPVAIERIHWPIDDPDQYEGDEEDVLPYFRNSRDDILARAKAYVEILKSA